MLTLAMLHELWPHGDDHVPGLLEGIAAAAADVFSGYLVPGDKSALVLAHAMAQFSHECGAGLEMIENLNYSAEGLLRTWPTRFTRDSAVRYAHNPEIIADYVYGGRMGNAPPPATDGWDFRGRGLSQVTGRHEYGRLGDMLQVDLAEDPDWVNDPAHALHAGFADFSICGCIAFAEKDDLEGVTRVLNGGLIGLPDRRAWLAKWKVALGAASLH
jgi:putative chitinase